MVETRIFVLCGTCRQPKRTAYQTFQAARSYHPDRDPYRDFITETFYTPGYPPPGFKGFCEGHQL